MKRLFVACAATLAALTVWAAPALAGGTTWDGNGAATCPNGSFWVLSPGKNVGTATLTVNGQVVGQMAQEGQQGGNGAYQLAAGPTVIGSTTASASWTGTSTAAFLKLSHCIGGTTTGGSTTGGDTTGGDTTGGDTTGGDTTGGDTTGGDTTTGGGHDRRADDGRGHDHRR
jgi:hypothetical protein